MNKAELRTFGQANLGFLDLPQEGQQELPAFGSGVVENKCNNNGAPYRSDSSLETRLCSSVREKKHFIGPTSRTRLLTT